MTKKIFLTGGGTAGHVTPNIALIPGLKERGYEITYVGSIDGIERKLIEDLGIRYLPIHTGKFRRNLDIENVKDIHRVFKGGRECLRLLYHERPDVIFSKGGFVSVPLVRAAKRFRIPVIIHESDLTPGLANKLCFSAAQKICCNFPETIAHLPKQKAVLSGSPIRPELLLGKREKGLRFTGFSGDKPVLLMIGGSLGAQKLNECLRAALPGLLPDFDIIHLTGKGKLDAGLSDMPGYRQFEYITDELPDLFAASDIIFSRAGANAICEFLALRKPNLLVPLPKDSSRGDQILNARSFERQGFSKVLMQEDLTPELLSESLHDLSRDREEYIRNMRNAKQQDSIRLILSLIDEAVTK